MKKLSLILWVASLISAICAGGLMFTHSTHYEVSIYFSNIPTVAWVLYSISLLISLYQLVYREEIPQHYPLATLALCLSILLALPLLKHYYSSSRFDQLEHIGYVKDLLNRMQISDKNIYPTLHILPAIIAFLFRFTPEIAVQFSLLPFAFLYTYGIYLIARELQLNSREIVMAIILSLLPIVPHQGSFGSITVVATLFPITIWLILRSTQSDTWRMITIAYIVSTVLLHPMAIVVNITALLMFWCFNNDKLKASFILSCLFMALLTYYTWFRGHTVYGMPMLVFSELFKIDFMATWNGTIAVLHRAQIKPWVIPIVAFRIHGGALLLFALAIIAIYFLFFTKYGREYGKEMKYLASLSALFLFLFFLYWTIGTNNSREFLNRAFYYIAPVSIIPVAVIMARAIARKYGKALVTCLLAVMALASTFNLYPSPYTYSPNLQATVDCIEGIVWLWQNSNHDSPVVHMGTSYRKFLIAAYGRIWYENHVIPAWMKYLESPIGIPDHFGYDQGRYLGEFFVVPTYMLITEYDRVLYKEVWKPPIPTRWGDDDFARLETDPTVKLLHENEGMSIYLILPAELM